MLLATFGPAALAMLWRRGEDDMPKLKNITAQEINDLEECFEVARLQPTCTVAPAKDTQTTSRTHCDAPQLSSRLVLGSCASWPRSARPRWRCCWRRGGTDATE
jgi:hypothetical protein